MNNLNIQVPKGTKLAIVGDIHEHKYQFDKLIKKINPSHNMYFISVGDLLDKGEGVTAGKYIVNTIKKMVEEKYAFMVKGNHECKYLNRLKVLSPELLWIKEQPIALSFVFPNNYRVTVIHGGVKPDHTWNDLIHNNDICYIRDLDENYQMIKLIKKNINGQKTYIPSKPNGKSWHEFYDGRFGYIVAGHEPLKDGLPRYYQNSCNIDTACYHTGKLTCQIIDENGLVEFISITK